MIYCGDTVFPNNFSENTISKLNKDFRTKEKIVNLESLIKLEEWNKTTKGIGLHSNKDIIKFLKEINTISASQANNHINDFDVSINKQKKFLKDNNIGSFGAGDNLEVAKEPYFYMENNIEYGVISFGWEIISCIAATENSKGVNPLKYNNVITQVKDFIQNYPSKKLICIFHWDYEFELYPHPAHRQLAFELIDLGVEAIIGHHPHIVQGYETYKNKTIFYSLGNFYFPDANYSGYEMKYNENAKNGLCVDLNEDIHKTTLYWSYIKDNQELQITKIENLFESQKMKELSSFAGMPRNEYIKWFRENRIKNKGLPIYKDIHSDLENYLNDQFTLQRQKFINFLVKTGVKK